jgi:predicted dehydrogenase
MLSGKMQLNIGFIGGGINSAVGNTHRIASQMDNRMKLVAGCFSTHQEINYETGKKWGVKESRIYDSWNELLEKEKGKLDAVCILTPTNIHSEMVIKALEMGYAVICEKAMGKNLNEAKRICDAAKKNKSFLAVTYNYTGYPMLRELKNMVETGKLGKISQIQIEMPQEGFARLDKNGNKPTPQKWRLEDGEIPTVSLDLGVHLHHIVYFLTQEKPIEVAALQSSYGHFKNVMDNVMSIARYTNDISVQVWYTKSAIGNRNGLKVRIYGEKAGAEWYQMNPEEIKYTDKNGRREIMDRASSVTISDELRYNRFKSGHPAGFIEAFANYYYDIAKDLEEYKETGEMVSKYVFGCDIAKDGLEMLEAIEKAASNKTWEKVKNV